MEGQELLKKTSSVFISHLPFFFEEKTITADIYHDTLTEYVTPQLEEFQPYVFFQLDGAPPHWGIKVCEFLDKKFPARWIGRGGPIAWPPRSPDITLGFFLVGLRERCCVPDQSKGHK